MKPTRVVVRIEDATLSRPLERAVAAFAGVEASDVVIDSTCPDCGRPHGKPRILSPTAHGGQPLVVSKSSAGGRVATAVAEGPRDIGVDLESVVAVSRARVDEVAFSVAERDLIDDEPPLSREALRTRLWSRKEAYLKATGQGVRLDLVRVDLAQGTPVPAMIVDVPWDEDSMMLSLAVLGDGPVTVELIDGSGTAADVETISGEAREDAC